MLASMDAMEFAEWVEWERLNGPLGSVRQTVVGAGVAHVTALCHAKKGTKFKASDFFALPTPFDDNRRRRGSLEITDPHAQIALFRAMAGQKTAGV